MNIKSAESAINTQLYCSGCVMDIGGCTGNIPHDCRRHLKDAAKIIIAASDQRIAELENQLRVMTADQLNTMCERDEARRDALNLAKDLIFANPISAKRIINKYKDAK